MDSDAADARNALPRKPVQAPTDLAMPRIYRTTIRGITQSTARSGT